MVKKISFLILLAFFGLSFLINAQIPTNGLVAYYPFNGNANDESGNGNNGTVNGATLTTDRFGNANKAYSFDGIKDFIIVNNTNVGNFNNDGTVSTWIYTDNSSFDHTEHFILAKDNGPYWIFHILADDSLQLTIHPVNWIHKRIKGKQALVNSWHHLLFTKKENNIKVFFDGYLVNNFTGLNNPINNNDPICVGKSYYWNSHFFKGKVDDIRIYNRALTEAEVSLLYHDPITITAGSVNGTPCDSVIVPVTVKNFTNIGATSLVLNYDTTKLSFGRTLNVNTQVAGTIVNANAGKIYISWSATGNPLKAATIADNGKLLDLKFQYKGGNTTLNWDTLTPGNCEIQDINNVDITTYYKNATVTEQLFSIKGKATYDNTASTVLNNIKVYLKLKGGANPIDSAITDASGNYEFKNKATGAYIIYAKATKPWGGANSSDALMIERNFLKIIQLAGVKKLATDVDNSGAGNATDALLVKRRFVRLINSFAAGDWAFLKDTVQVNCAILTKDIKGLCYGDVNGSFIPAKSKKLDLMPVNSSEIIYVKTGAEFEVPVYTGKSLTAGALSLVLNYNANLAKLISIESDLPGLIYSIDEGTVRIAWTGIEGRMLNNNEPLFVMKLKAKAGFGAGQTLLFTAGEECEIADENIIAINDIWLNIAAVEAKEALGIDDNYGYVNSLLQNIPNPAQNETMIAYSVAENAKINLTVYNTLGMKVAELVNENKNAGAYKLNFNTDNLPDGMYFYKIDIKGAKSAFSLTKMLSVSK